MVEGRSAFVVGRTAVIAAVVLALALGTVRVIGGCVERTIPMHSRGRLGQLHRISDAIDSATAGLGDAAFIGSSQTMFGFDPAVFDAALADRGHRMATLNFGTIPSPPILARILADRLCEAHRMRGTRWRLLLFELAPESLTTDTPNSTNDEYAQAIHTMAIDTGALLRGPHDAAELAVGRALGYHAPFAVANALKKYLYADLGPSPPAADWQLARQRYLDLYRPSERGDWNAESRGFVRIDSPEMASAFQDYLRLQNSPEGFARQRDDAQQAGITSMNISWVAVARTIELVREIGRCPDRVILVLYPVRPTISAIVTADAHQRRRDAVAAIRRATGFEVIDLFDDPSFGVDEFQDEVHLTMTSGAQLFGRVLASRVADSLEHQR